MNTENLETIATFAIGVEAVDDGCGVITVRIDSDGDFFVFTNGPKGDVVKQFTGAGAAQLAFAFAIQQAQGQIEQELEDMGIEL